MRKWVSPEVSLPELRKQICLNSLFYDDYENDFGFDRHSVGDFFDGYMEYLSDLAGEGAKIEDIFKLDTTENLIEWYYCMEIPEGKEHGFLTEEEWNSEHGGKR